MPINQMNTPTADSNARDIVSWGDVGPAIRHLRDRYPESKLYLRFRGHIILRRLYVGGHAGWSAMQPKDTINTIKWRANTWTWDALLNVARYCYWSNLFNQVVYTYFRDFSRGKSIEKSVLFPEILGNCPGACEYHLEPFYALDSLFGVKTNQLDLMEVFPIVATYSQDWLRLVSGQSEESLPGDLAVQIMERCAKHTREVVVDERVSHEH